MNRSIPFTPQFSRIILTLVAGWLPILAISAGNPSLTEPPANPPSLSTMDLPSLAAEDTVPLKLRLGCPQIENSLTFNMGEFIYQSIGAQLGWDIELVPMPGLRSLVESNAGRLDGEAGRILALGEKGEFKDLIRIEESLFSLHMGVYSLDSGQVILDWKDLQSGRYRVGVSSNYWIIGQKFQPFRHSPWLIEAKDPKHMIRLLMGNRVDLIVDLDEVISHSPDIMPEAQNDSSPWPPIYRVGIVEMLPVFPYLHKKHLDKVEAFTEALRQVKADQSSFLAHSTAEPEPGLLWKKPSP